MQSTADRFSAESDPRQADIHAWLENTVKQPVESLQMIFCDASFRRYFRLHSEGRTFVVMDAPPEHEDTEPYIGVTHAFEKQGIHVPSIYATDIEAGFILMSDFGDALLQHSLNDDTADHFYGLAMDCILQIQCCSKKTDYVFPAFDDKAYLAEFNLFRYWYLAQNRRITLSADDNRVLEELLRTMQAECEQQIQCCVHRDFHSRNIMVTAESTLGIIDFQDAVWASVTYDIVSLLRDFYVEWPLERVYAWLLQFYQKLQAEGGLTGVAYTTFERWFDWQTLQRSVKCMGIFSRIVLRDGKQQFEQYIPTAKRYIELLLPKYPELTAFAEKFHQWTNT